MIIFQVHHYIQPDKVGEYKSATLENAKKTILEPGVFRFDVFQDKEDPTHFSLLEVYEDEMARDAHLQTEHFEAWKDVYLATQAKKGHGDDFRALFPPSENWGKI